MMSDSATYTLTAADASAFRKLIQAGSALGPARQTPDQADFWAFFAAIDAIAYDHYRFIANAQVKNWADELFTALPRTKTCYGIDAAGMYVLYAYAQFTATCILTLPPGSQDNIVNGACYQGFPIDWAQGGGRQSTFDPSRGQPEASPWSYFAALVGDLAPPDLWRPPAAPASFFNALMDAVNIINGMLQADANAAIVALLDGFGGSNPDPASVVQFEQSRFDPKNWTDSHQFVRNLAGTNLWAEQSQTVTALLQPATLPAATYFFLLHLLLALPTSTVNDQQLTQRIVSASASSQEYPNDTFINQLVYLTLLYLADPLGNFAWTNAQLIAETALWRGLMTARDPASVAIRDSLLRHQRVLQTDAAYPMQDPYTSINFTQRKTDTLFALDEARHALTT